MNTRNFSLIDATGTPSEIGRAQAEGSLHNLNDIQGWIQGVTERHSLRDRSVRRHLTDVELVLERHSPETLEQLAAMSAIYQLPAENLLLANLGTYFDCLLDTHSESPSQDLDGCSTVAFSDGRDGPVLAKNRDNNRRFLNMQMVLRVTPTRGFRWVALSTAGAPDVHSSGMNQLGLAIADTHVPSRDVGPGLPRFTIMAQVLARCEDVPAALDLMRSIPHLGLGNLILADMSGRIAVVESGHRRRGIRERSSGHLAATNHFVDKENALALREDEASESGQDSRRRLDSVERAAAVAPRSDLSAAAEAMLFDPIVCRRNPGAEWLTTSTTIFNTRLRSMRLRVGDPAVSVKYESIALFD